MAEDKRKPLDAESRRLVAEVKRDANWKRWGPYLAERQWGTVREDYSADGACWDSFPHDHARSRAYRWGEDGLLGITDRQCRLCFALALWNGNDPILKERLFGVTGPQGNHGEDVKENYYYLDSTPTHSYMHALYKYPQGAYPYDELVAENGRRDKSVGEYELCDTGLFDDGRYFDVEVEYAKGGPNDILAVVTVTNRGPDAAPLHLLPTLWFRNTWIWGCAHEGCTLKPRIERLAEYKVSTEHESLGRFHWDVAPASNGAKPTMLFTENETNSKLLFDVDQYTPYVRDAFHRYVIHGEHDAVRDEPYGTKVAAYYRFDLAAGESVSVWLRLSQEDEAKKQPFGAGFSKTFDKRKAEADAFYATRLEACNPAQRDVMRQAYAGLLWTKQFYHYIVEDWLEGDPASPTPPASRYNGRNHDWPHLFNRDVISMPDKWEYPWYAAWDLAFHMIPFCRVDPTFAKRQLTLFLREWYMHPNGQIPAYEFNFSDVNPPGACLGLLARLQDDRSTRRQA